ncbi:MAG TPA: hypothetical protein VEC99_03370 [Clostridia bacterium]|nr:hypothetical protein [Clostridia bacterium]
MSFELRAADNRVCGLAAEQAIEGAVRYLTATLANYQTNGVMPDPATYLCEAVPVGQLNNREEQRSVPHFWLIGRDTNSLTALNQVSFGLVDEASKLNLNTATSNELIYLPRMNVDLVEAILDWRDTNGGSGAFQLFYGMHNPPYQNKGAPFETVAELKLLYGADLYTLEGEDRNLNGVLDPNETDEDHNGFADPGVLDCLTVYSREPSTYSNGVARVDITSVGANSPLATLLQSTLGQAQADRILGNLGVSSGGGQRPPGQGGGGGAQQFTSPLQLFRRSQMTSDEFSLIAKALTTRGTNYIDGRININTANATVLSCLPGLVDYPDLAQTLIQYRQQNPDKLTSIAWVVEALGSNNASVLDAIEAEDCLTTESYQFTADIAALGPYGRGYRRIRYVIDTVDGAPKIVFRQDLTHLGWGLGKEVRQTWLAAKDTR